jgi:chromosome segregation ATPase
MTQTKPTTTLNTQVKIKRQELDDIAERRLAALEDSVGADDKRQRELSEVVDSLDQKKIKANEELDELLEKQTLQEAKIEYAVRHMHDLAKQWRDASFELRQRFQSMVFPEGLTLDVATMQFGTEKISPLYRYATNKKDLSLTEKSRLVTSRGIEPRLPG